MIGRMFGRYRVVSFLDEGGAAKIWKAEDTLLQIPVVIKVFPSILTATAGRREEILKEARNTAKLDHPNIASALDAGESDDGLYIVLRYVEGETLARAIEQGDMSFSRIVEVGRAIAQALEHAHAKGVVHRDVTSRNVMISSDGQPKLIDFGLSVSRGNEILTTTGVIKGTLEFMAPEVVQGDRADERADLYGLGCVLYHMVAGSTPFRVGEGENILPRILGEAPTALRDVRESTPASLEGIIERLLEKNPAARFRSARELDDALGALERSGALERADESERDRAAAGPSRARRAMSRLLRRLQRGVARIFIPPRSGIGWAWTWPRAATVLALATLIVLAVRREAALHQLPAVRSVAVLPLRNMGPEPEGSAYLLEGIGEAMVTRLSKVSGLRVLPWLTTAAYSDSGRTPEDLGRELNVDELLVGTFVMAGDHIHVTVAVVDARKGWQVWGDQFEEPTSDILTMQKNLALAVATSLKGRLSGQEEELVSRGPTENAAAYADYLKGSHLLRDGSEQATTLALDYFDRALRADSSLVEAYVGAGAAETRRYFQGWEGGEAGLDQAEERFSRALALDPGSVAARRGMIRVKWERSDTEGCLLLGKQLADQGKDDIESLVARGEAYFLGGLPEMAPPLLQQALQLDPHNEAAAWTLPIAETWAGKPQDALLAADRFTKIFGPDPEVETWAAASYDLLGDLDRADQHYQDAIELFGDDSNLYVYLFASRVAREKGDVAGTHRLLSTGLDLAQRRLVKSPDNVRLQGFVALFQAMLGERERCETTLKSSGLAKKGHYLAQAEWVKVISAQIAWGDTATALEECRGALEYCPLGLTPPPGTARLLDWPGNLPPAFGPILKLAQEARARLVTIY